MDCYRILLIHPTIQPNGVDYLKTHSDVFLAPDGKTETLIEWINRHSIQAVLTRCEIIGKEIMDACPSLKVIGQHGVGLDNIDVNEATAHQIQVLNVPDATYFSVAEHTMMFLLALSRSLRINDCCVRADGWYSRESRYTTEIYQKTLLIVGFGRIGRTVARLAQAFGMRVLAYDGFVSKKTMEELGVGKIEILEDGLGQADFVSLHVPLTPVTQGMMSTDQFQAMKQSAYLISMGRGPVVDETALIQALRTGEIAGAGLDVLEQEPPDKHNPLFQMDQVLFTPHIGGDTREAKRRASEILSRTVLEALDGQAPYNWVNLF